MILFALIAPFVPGLLWLWFFYTRDKYQPEPKRVVAWTFVLGGIAAAPAVFGEGAAERIFPFSQQLVQAVLFEGRIPAGTVFVMCFLIVGPIEELCKFAAVRFYAARHRAFDEPMDGLIYSSAAALGFASVENVLYIWGVESAGGGVALLTLRALLSVPGHVFFASIWGWALGRRLLEPRRPWLVPGALVLSSVAHGAWDFTLIHPDARVLFLPLFGTLAWLLLRLLRWGRENSQFRPDRRYVAVPPGSTDRRCVRCGLTVSMDDVFCTRCGGRILPARLACPHCDAPLTDRTDRFCGRCGQRFELPAFRCSLCGTELRDPTATACPTCAGCAAPAAPA